MYVPGQFAVDDDAVRELLVRRGVGDLITATGDGVVASFLPFVFDADAGVLRGHLARNNPQWRSGVVGDGLVIVHGGDSYVSPAWYASKAEHGRVVPTWNYITAHVYGEVRFHDDLGWVGRVVRELTEKHEGVGGWSVDDAPDGFVEGQLRAVVGVEVVVRRVEGKWKLSQNRSGRDIDGVVAGLRGVGDVAGAEAVEAARPVGK